MEYCPLSLKQEKKLKGGYTEAELKRILRDICIGLKYIHSQQVVHLDIKPGKSSI
jgi:Serine/threonine protein kinase